MSLGTTLSPPYLSVAVDIFDRCIYRDVSRKRRDIFSPLGEVQRSRVRAYADTIKDKIGDLTGNGEDESATSIDHAIIPVARHVYYLLDQFTQETPFAWMPDADRNDESSRALRDFFALLDVQTRVVMKCFTQDDFFERNLMRFLIKTLNTDRIFEKKDSKMHDFLDTWLYQFRGFTGNREYMQQSDMILYSGRNSEYPGLPATGTALVEAIIHEARSHAGRLIRTGGVRYSLSDMCYYVGIRDDISSGSCDDSYNNHAIRDLCTERYCFDTPEYRYISYISRGLLQMLGNNGYIPEASQSLIDKHE